MKDVFNQLKGKSAKISLSIKESVTGPVVEIHDGSVGINTGSGIEYFSYRYIVSVKEHQVRTPRTGSNGAVRDTASQTEPKK